MFDVGVIWGIEKVAAGYAAVIEAEDTASGSIDPIGDSVRSDRHPSTAERKKVRRRKKSEDRMNDKTAENTSQAVGYKSPAQNDGEAESSGSAPGVTGQTIRPVSTRGRVERTGGGKSGVPMWVRFSKNLQSKYTRSGGDKVGPQESDNQFESPKENP
jgi:hypothetical protein